MNKRNPRLVPYILLDEKTKKTNRDSVCAAVRTLIGYGYNIEPPDQESSECPSNHAPNQPLHITLEELYYTGILKSSNELCIFYIYFCIF